MLEIVGRGLLGSRAMASLWLRTTQGRQLALLVDLLAGPPRLVCSKLAWNLVGKVGRV